MRVLQPRFQGGVLDRSAQIARQLDATRHVFRTELTRERGEIRRHEAEAQTRFALAQTDLAIGEQRSVEELRSQLLDLEIAPRLETSERQIDRDRTLADIGGE